MAIVTTRRSRINVAFLLTSSLFIASSSASLTSQFQNFYPQHGSKYTYILYHNCSQQFANYLTGRSQDFKMDWLGGGGKYSVLVQPVVTCLLTNVSEYIKSAAASAQVLLGVTPPILATLGSSTDELAMLNIVGRRPLLSLLISFGSPCVFVDRVFDFRQPERMLQQSQGKYRFRGPCTSLERWVLVVGQYAAVLGAVANIATLSWQLGVRTVCIWWPQTVFAPLVWTVLGVPIHVAGTFATRLRVRRIYSEHDKKANIMFGQWFRLLPTRLYRFLKSEWVPAICQDKIRTVSFDEGKFYVVWAWLLSAATVIHILFGSLVFSSLLFIGPRDALLVIFRYMVSVFICRIIVTFELAGLRHHYVPEPGKGRPL